jgi:hypothetical protein
MAHPPRSFPTYLHPVFVPANAGWVGLQFGFQGLVALGFIQAVIGKS